MSGHRPGDGPEAGEAGKLFEALAGCHRQPLANLGPVDVGLDDEIAGETAGPQNGRQGVEPWLVMPAFPPGHRRLRGSHPAGQFGLGQTGLEPP